MKKLFISFFVTVMLLISATSVFATEVTHTSAGQVFTSSWELYDSGTNWVMEYGFNEYFIDEDYTHAKHNSLGSTAIVQNGSGSHSGGASAGNWAVVDVVHNGSSITYKMVY